MESLVQLLTQYLDKDVLTIFRTYLCPKCSSLSTTCHFCCAHFFLSFYEYHVSVEDWPTHLIVSRGYHRKLSHGGACEWILLSDVPSTKCSQQAISPLIPYHGEKYLYVFSYFDNFEEVEQVLFQTKLGQFMIQHFPPSKYSYSKNPSNEYFLFCNDKLEEEWEEEEWEDGYVEFTDLLYF